MENIVGTLLGLLVLSNILQWFLIHRQVTLTGKILDYVAKLQKDVFEMRR